MSRYSQSVLPVIALNRWRRILRLLFDDCVRQALHYFRVTPEDYAVDEGTDAEKGWGDRNSSISDTDQIEPDDST